MATGQSPTFFVQAAQQQQQQQPQPASQPASQSAPQLQTAAPAPAAANGSSSHDPSKSLRMADSAAQHEAYYKAKMQAAQASHDVIGAGTGSSRDTAMRQTQAFVWHPVLLLLSSKPISCLLYCRQVSGGCDVASAVDPLLLLFRAG